jgi:GNAT superfamily N-acetyltransferase
MTLTITAVSPYESVAEELIAELSAELGALYGDDGTGLFQPEDVNGPRAIFLVAYDNERPVACGALRPINNKTAEIKRMYVRRDNRGQGVSRQLLEALEQRAKEFDYQHIILETGYRQLAAVGLYEHAGYKVIPNYGPYVGNPDSVCFEKNLISS